MTDVQVRRGANDQLAVDYWRDGYATVRNCFNAGEIAGWRTECDRLWSLLDADPEADRVQWRGHVRHGQIRDRIDPVVDISPVFAALAADPRILTPVGDVLRAEPTLMKAKLVTKRPGTAGYAMHQDFPYWAPLGIPADDLLTLQVGIDPARVDNGAVELFARLHHRRLEARPEEPLDVDESRMDLTRGEVMELLPGDLLLFHSLTPHRSGTNGSNDSRRAVFFTYTTAAHGDIYRRYHEQQRVGLGSVQ